VCCSLGIVGAHLRRGGRLTVCRCGAESAAECSCEYLAERAANARWAGFWRRMTAGRPSWNDGPETFGCANGCTCDVHETTGD
jgi:hypothetical protein